MSDFSYTDSGLYTAFMPNNTQAISAWLLIAEQTDGTGKVFSVHVKSVIAQLNKAGYTVTRSKKVTKSDLTLIYNELDSILNQLDDLK